MRSSKPTAGPYGWLPALVAGVTLAGMAVAGVGLWQFHRRLVVDTGETLALAAAGSVETLRLLLDERARRLRRFGVALGSHGGERSRLAADLRALAAAHPEYRWIAVTDAGGHVLATSDRTGAGARVRIDAELAVARGDALDARIVRAAAVARHRPVLVFTVPLVDTAGTRHGALVAIGRLGEVRRVFDRSMAALRRRWNGAATPTWHLVAPNGELVTGSDRDPPRAKLGLPSAFASASGSPGWLEEHDAARNVPMLTGYARLQPVHATTTSRWALLVHVDRADVLDPIAAAVTKLAALWAVVLLPLLGTTVWATTRLRREWFDSREESRRARRAQEAADASEGRMRAILDHAAEGIVTTDGDGVIRSFNAAAARMFGWTPEEACGRSIARLVPSGAGGRHARTAPRWLDRAVRRRRGRALALVGCRRDGTRFPLGLSLGRVASGERPVYVAIVRDLTDEKRAEMLAHARDMAEAASRAKSDFLATMSHEIRTPLNGVVGMTALLLETGLDDEQREYAESLRTCSAALLGVVDDVLDYSKLEAGKLELEVIDFDLRRTVEDVVELFAERADRKGIELAAVIDPSIPTALRGDPNRLRQILSNLLANALKFTERGEVLVRASCTADGADAVRLELAVVDTGIGIPPERQSLIFESFAQSDVAIARLYGGSGLGLAIVKRLATLMGGQIVVDSEPGVGSTFTLLVRLGRQPDAAAAAVQPALRGRRVLVVDDNPTVRGLLRSHLRFLGLRPATSEDGTHAVAMLRAAAHRTRRFDVALIDLDAPGIDGVALARMIADDPAIAVPTVLMAPLARRGAARQAGGGAGVAAYLSKPIRLDRLHDCLLGVLGGGRERSARAGAPPAPAPGARRGRVLVAEDDATSQTVVARLLQKRGHRVDVVGDGRSAVTACRAERYDLVLMDCRLPELDGFAATAEIRRSEPPARRTPIVALTASASPDLRARCFAVGMSGYCTKPLRVDELDAVLARFVSADAPALAVSEPPAVLDLPGLLERVDGDLAFAHELASAFRRDRPRWLAALRAAVDAGDRAGVERIAHVVRGSAGNLGGLRVAGLAARIEHRARIGDGGASAAAIAELERELECFLAALESLAYPHVAAS